MPLTESEARAEVVDLAPELDKRGRQFRTIEGYYTGDCPFPPAIVQAKVTKAYRMLMAYAQTNYARLVVKAATSRMEIGGIRTGSKDLDDQLWDIWQQNFMDAESRRGFDNVLTHGRVFAIVWAQQGDPFPQITLEQADTTLVEYRPGSRYHRVSGLRRWLEGKKPFATLYKDDALYKFVGPDNTSGGHGTQWKPRVIEGEDWPLEHSYGTVPVVEIATNRRLKSSRFGYARGDYESETSLLDRINLLEFLRLVIAFTSGFPLRVVIGDKILRDDDGNPIAPFELAADLIAQLENPDAKIQELAAADLEKFGKAIDHDVETLAGITMTPAYYLRSVPIQNVSADAIRASDSPLNARLADHKPDIGEGYEEVLRVSGRMLPKPIDVPAKAAVTWVNRESRSLAERADATSKLQGMPWQFIAEKVWDLTQEEVTRYEEAMGANTMAALMQQATSPGGGIQ